MTGSCSGKTVTEINSDCSSLEKVDFGAADAHFRELIIDRILAFEHFRKVLAEPNAEPNSATAALISIRNLAHKIAGVAATLGYVETGKLANALETYIWDMEERPNSENDILTKLEQNLEALLKSLETLLDQDFR